MIFFSIRWAWLIVTRPLLAFHAPILRHPAPSTPPPAAPLPTPTTPPSAPRRIEWTRDSAVVAVVAVLVVVVLVRYNTLAETTALGDPLLSYQRACPICLPSPLPPCQNNNNHSNSNISNDNFGPRQSTIRMWDAIMAPFLHQLVS